MLHFKYEETWNRILFHLMKEMRQRAGLSQKPTQALIDSQNVKTTGDIEQKGFDMRKTKGIKRRIVAHDIGCLLTTVIH